MSVITGSFGLKMRHLGRRLGINPLITRLMFSRDYEARYGTAIALCVEEGDVVWDIGANVGYYTRSLSHQVGSSGQVFAFEPSPQNVFMLGEHIAKSGNVVIMPVALSNRSGEFSFKEEMDGTASYIASDRGYHSDTLITVDGKTGDEVIRNGEAAFPNIVKIDVEGHELEVLLGLSAALKDRRLRCVFVEVHFGILRERGMHAAPRQIEQILIEAGFHISWTDPSHIQALRGAGRNIAR